MERGRIIPLLVVEFNIPGWPISWWGYLLANIGEKCTCVEKLCRNLKNDVGECRSCILEKGDHTVVPYVTIYISNCQ